MADITMCRNKSCKLKYQCYRFMAIENKFRQSYFLDNPKIVDGKCSEQILIVDDKINNLGAYTMIDHNKPLD